MRKVELTISSDYVPGWGLTEGIRELFQNAIDQEVQSKGTSPMSFRYDGNELTIGNSKSTLSMQTLLLGSTGKSTTSDTIGQFGEGYKIATLALLRAGKTVVFYNGNEVWRPRLVNSRRFKTTVLTFFIEAGPLFQRKNNLEIAIGGITQEEYDLKLVPYNLYLQGDYAYKRSPVGMVLTEERHSSRVFVGGLFVCDYPKYKYGYNFNPGMLKLDRDRKLASDFDLQWVSSRVWVTDELLGQALDLSRQGCADVAYVQHMYGSSLSNLKDMAYDDFRAKYGEFAVPVTSQDDYIPTGYKGIIVPDSYYNLVRGSYKYSEPTETPVSIEELLDELQDMFSRISSVYDVSEKEHLQFMTQLGRIRNRVCK